MTGLIPFFWAALTRSIVPAREPWSVSATAGIWSSAARAARAGMRHAPSRIEYSEWTWRWTKGAPGTGRPLYERSRTALETRLRSSVRLGLAGFRTQGLDHVALSVRDQERSERWYREVLGLERVHEEEWEDVPVMLVADGTGVALFRA